MADEADANRITEAHKAIANAWFTKHWKNAVCLVCQEHAFVFGDHLVQPLTYSQSSPGTVLGGPTYPLFQVICKSCGYTYFFNALIMGVVARDSAQTRTGS